MFPHNRRFSALAYMFFSLHYPRPARERLLVVYRFLPWRDHLSKCYFERAGYVPPIATNRKTTFVFLSCSRNFFDWTKMSKMPSMFALFTLYTFYPTFYPFYPPLFTLTFYTFYPFYLSNILSRFSCIFIRYIVS